MDHPYEITSTGSTPPGANLSPKANKNFNIFESVQEDREREEEENPAPKENIDNNTNNTTANALPLVLSTSTSTKYSPPLPLKQSPSSSRVPPSADIQQDSYDRIGTIIRSLNSEMEEERFGELLQPTSIDQEKDWNGLPSILARQPTTDSLVDQSPCVTLKTGSMRKQTPRVSGQSTPSTPQYPEIIISPANVPMNKTVSAAVLGSGSSDVYSYERSSSFD